MTADSSVTSGWTLTRAALDAMLREEWRLHSSLFGGRRFAVFPLFVAAAVGGSAVLLDAVGVRGDAVIAGVFALVFVFGLHTGTIGLVGRDAMGDLLGDVTLIVFTARTLPLSPRRLVGVFVVKDVLYYSGLFLIPIAVGLAPATPAGPSLSAAGPVALLWVGLTATFVVGLLTTIALIGLADRGVSGRAVIAVAALLAIGAWWFGVDVAPFTPYGLYASPGLTAVGSTVALLVGTLVVAGVAFDVPGTESGRGRRTVDPTFGRFVGRVEDPVAAKTLLDVGRSSGGFWKVGLSAGILFAVTAGLVTFVGRITAVPPSTAVSFGAVLGFSGFTAYNWVTQFDDVAEYTIQPLSVRDVLAGKFRAFLLVGPATALVFYLVALAWRGSSVTAGVAGAVLVVGVTAYTGGLTMYLAGLSPNEFLFDTTLFGLFWLGIAVPTIPVLIAGFVLVPLSAAALVGVALWGAVLGAVGFGLMRASREKWDRYHRAG